MKISVNLLQESEQIASRVKKIGVFLQTVSIIVLVIFGIIVASLLSSTLFISNRLSTLEEDIEAEEVVIKSLSDVESKQLVVKNKITFTQQLLNENPSSYDLLFKMFTFATARSTVNDVVITPSEGLILMSIQTENVFLLVTFLEEFVGFLEEENILNVRSGGFSRIGDGTYSFDMIILYEPEV